MLMFIIVDSIVQIYHNIFSGEFQSLGINQTINL